ncbi:head decoration protein [Wolbachia endosymbiont of Anopheles demeilloni]|uniref:head decoration protein n=1 Tax=Wolbachia endosymbiont of Anopheles demeilloni TaxID=2748871 RepID=UPI001BDB268C|nr:head decoration protein [Wolbachia endosymbiont of Anopheles demeilloni]UIP93038.1 head decoration protein [Wolbachia endosymbiont of Anopheles demeilloni]
MTCITEQNNLGDLLKYEASNLYSRDQITVAKRQNLKLGTVVALDKDSMVKIINPTITDGAQTAIGVITSDVNSKDGDTKAIIITRISLLADHAVVWPENITEEQKAEAIKQLEVRGIIVRKGA